MVNIGKSLVAVAAGLCASWSAIAAPSAQVRLDNFLQNGIVRNHAASDAAISSIVYSLGAAGNGIATWQNSAAGGVASDFLSRRDYFQTITFNNLSVAPGRNFEFGSLDIDLIVTLSPLEINESVLDETGSSLAHAFMSISWDDGSQATTRLAQRAWTENQSLVFRAGPPVPEPASMALLTAGLAFIGVCRRRSGHGKI